MHRVPGAVVALTVLVLAAAPPAAGHALDALGTGEHRAEIVGLSPDVRGVSVRLVDDGTRIELDAGERTVVVLGYQGEPYLRVGPDGAFENRRSPSTYVNRSLVGVAPPPEADADAPPRWTRIGDGRVVRWHDHALHVPPSVEAGVRTSSEWSRPMLVDGDEVELRGRIVDVPSRSGAPWWLAAVVVGAGVVALAIRSPRAAVALAIGLALVADVARSIGEVLGPPAWLDLRGEVASGLVRGAVVGWPLALIALVLLVRRNHHAAAAVGVVAAGTIAVVGGFTEVGELTHADIVTALPDTVARAAIALAIGAGSGGAFAALRLLFARQTGDVSTSAARTT